MVTLYKMGNNLLFVQLYKVGSISKFVFYKVESILMFVQYIVGMYFNICPVTQHPHHK